MLIECHSARKFARLSPRLPRNSPRFPREFARQSPWLPKNSPRVAKKLARLSPRLPGIKRVGKALNEFIKGTNLA